ncbi:VOC family protein [Piscinibacter sp.]|uniref:VOC family protein n=1 Tax=Piscinibacter sp. TaxID=1903157 RepID=UPI002CBC74FF|nr:VOC family protein [Albitalea sp.]HUG26125.1 VOC family protein [Albitalea sp.]
MSLALDHLVVAARTLDDGVAWCEATFGLVPGPGGKHPLMGTHNRLFSIGSPVFPKAYFEIIAIDADAPSPGRVRWFDLDTPAMQQAVADGPRLIHWVARCDDVAERIGRWRTGGVDRGELLAAERDTPDGALRWRISVRADGARLCGGALPTLIAWGDRHPTDTMPGSGVTLEALRVAGLPAAVAAEGAGPGISFDADGPPLTATLSTPRGRVTLTSLSE